MTASDADRFALYSRLEEVLGVSEADYLMKHLSREPGDQVATKADIARLEGDISDLEQRFDARFDRIDARFDRLEDRLDRMQRFYVGTTVWSMTALTAIFTLVVTFFG